MGHGGHTTMKRRRHTREQVIRKLAEADKLLENSIMTAAELQPRSYHWRRLIATA
jgi:hypothetical protein